MELKSFDAGICESPCLRLGLLDAGEAIKMDIASQLLRAVSIFAKIVYFPRAQTKRPLRHLNS